jgi:5'-nucleotidase
MFNFDMENVIISNKKGFEEIRKKIVSGGVQNFHVIADFDGTLTKGFVDKIKCPSIIAELRNGNYLSEKYAVEAHALFDKYHPIEIDPLVSFKEKKIKMEEWWRRHFDLLIKEGLNKSDLKKVVQSDRVELRNGMDSFLKFLKQNNVPLIIMSASGVGDVIPMYLKEKNLMYDNIQIISNFYEWDLEGRAIGVKEPVIHSANKDEHTLENLSIYASLKSRKNVLLLGNGMNDLSMIEGFFYKNLLNIGFLNSDKEKNLEVFKSGYDVVLTEDTTMDFVNEFLKGFG